MKTKSPVAHQTAELCSARAIAARQRRPAKALVAAMAAVSVVPAATACGLCAGGVWLAVVSSASAAPAEPARADQPTTIGGGAVARVLPPTEKIKVLEEELARETERRVKAEEDIARRTAESKEAAAGAKIAAKDRASLEARLADMREREAQLQKANDRLRMENERIAVTIRVSLPIVALVSLAVLGLLVWIVRFLRQVAARVHDVKTLAEIHELEAKATHAAGQLEAELKRNHTLRGKLAELGIVDEEVTPRPSGSWRSR